MAAYLEIEKVIGREILDSRGGVAYSQVAAWSVG